MDWIDRLGIHASVPKTINHGQGVVGKCYQHHKIQCTTFGFLFDEINCQNWLRHILLHFDNITRNTRVCIKPFEEKDVHAYPHNYYHQLVLYFHKDVDCYSAHNIDQTTLSFANRNSSIGGLFVNLPR